jgi:hypothetical protein
LPELDKEQLEIKLKPMDLLADSFRESLRNTCRRFRVERLYLFGSAADGRFNSEHSDLDFLVTLEEQSPADYADNYLGLAQALEKLFGRPADLVTERSIRNPYFRESVFAARQLLYDRRDEKSRCLTCAKRARAFFKTRPYLPWPNIPERSSVSSAWTRQLLLASLNCAVSLTSVTELSTVTTQWMMQ